MRLSPIVDRLKDTAVCPSLKWVELALTSAIPTAFPAAYVFLLSEKAAPNSLDSAFVRQEVTAIFAVEWMVRNAAAGAAGGAAAVSLETLRDEGMAALLGWSPSESFRAIEFAGGGLLAYADGAATWRDQFSTKFYIGN